MSDTPTARSSRRPGSAAVARLATDHDHQLIDGYGRYCQGLIDAGVLTGQLNVDLDLLLVKDLGGFGGSATPPSS